MTQTEATTRSSALQSPTPLDAVSLQSASKIYGTFAALRNVSTTFAAGTNHSWAVVFF